MESSLESLRSAKAAVDRRLEVGKTVSDALAECIAGREVEPTEVATVVAHRIEVGPAERVEATEAAPTVGEPAATELAAVDSPAEAAKIEATPVEAKLVEAEEPDVRAATAQPRSWGSRNWTPNMAPATGFIAELGGFAAPPEVFEAERARRAQGAERGPEPEPDNAGAEAESVPDVRPLAHKSAHRSRNALAGVAS